MTNTFDFSIYPREADVSKRLSLQNIGAFILDAAGMAAKTRGFGMDYMHERGLAWVTSRIAIEMMEYPHEYETISIETWVEDCTSIFSTRNFLIYNSRKEIIGQASTIWSMIDFNTRKMVDLLKSTDLGNHVATTQNPLFTISTLDSELLVIPDNKLLICSCLIISLVSTKSASFTTLLSSAIAYPFSLNSVVIYSTNLDSKGDSSPLLVFTSL
jgi:acyl-CoA thioesterase FadM